MAFKHSLRTALLVAAAVGSSPAFAASGGEDTAPAPVQSSPVSAELEARFQALNAEFIAAWSHYQDALQAARAESLPRRQYPVAPSKAFHGRFDELAMLGHPGALRWCIEHVDVAGLDSSMARQRRMDLYRLLVDGNADQDWMVEVAAEVRRAQAARSIDIEAAASVCADIYAKSKNPKVKQQALYNEALVWAAGTGQSHTERALALYERVIAEYPGTEIAGRVQGKITQLKYLQIGLVAPEVVTADADGVPFKLSDYRGKVVLLDFWGFW